MRSKIFSTLSAALFIGLFALPATAIADGNETGEPENSISEAHEGVEVSEWLAVGGSLLIAAGLAFVIGRRSGRKQ